MKDFIKVTEVSSYSDKNGKHILTSKKIIRTSNIQRIHASSGYNGGKSSIRFIDNPKGDMYIIESIDEIFEQLK